MKEKLIEIIIGIVLMTTTYFLGGWDFALQTLMIMIALDYATGFLKAWHDKNLSSLIGAKGIIKKVGYLIIVGIAVILDNIVEGSNGAIRTLVIYFFIANEGISIIENWSSLGLPMPDIIKTTLSQIKNHGQKPTSFDSVVQDMPDLTEDEHSDIESHEVE